MRGGTAELLAVVALSANIGCAHRAPRTAAPYRPRPAVLHLMATAYCQTGRTASGVLVRPGMVAADPALLPLGSIVRIVEPREVGGTFTVADTGGAIKGEKLDIFMTDCRRAVRFGRKPIVVRVVRRGAAASDER